MGGSAQVLSRKPTRLSRVTRERSMKHLTVWQGALLALSLAVVSTPAFAGDSVGPSGGYGGQRDCYKCPPPRNYDTQEVVKNTRDVDHSRTIETQSVVPSKRLIETNHLIIKENETRNVGTIEHNHTIIEKELVLTKRNVDTKQVNTVVNLVEHKYNTQRQHVVEEREIPGENRNLTNCNCESPVRAYGMSTGADAYGSAPKYVKSRY
jgi:hypothetical protein